MTFIGLRGSIAANRSSILFVFFWLDMDAPSESEECGAVDLDEQDCEINCDGPAGTTSRCSVRVIYNVISKFSKEKQDIVKSMGWGGILLFPYMSKLNLKLSSFLLMHVDPVRRAIVLGPDKVFPFGATDVNKVFGLPCKGMNVRKSTIEQTEEVVSKVRSRLGMNTKERRSLKAVQAILEKEHLGPMQKDDVDAFKTALVVFVMGNLLAPTTMYDYTKLGYWPALSDPDSLHNFNWC